VKGDISHLLRCAAEFNVTGQPAITLSGGFDKHGAPIRFQLVGKLVSESLLPRAGHAYQSVTHQDAWHPTQD
jgi:amidase